MDTAKAVIGLITVLLGGGVGKFVLDWFRDYRNRPSKAVQAQASIDANIVTVAKARDELEEDNRRLRMTMKEERGNWFVERARYEAEMRALRERIVALENQVIAERDAAEARYNKLLASVRDLRRQADPDTPGRGNDIRSRY